MKQCQTVCLLIRNVNCYLMWKPWRRRALPSKLKWCFEDSWGTYTSIFFFLFSLTRGNYTELLYQEIHFKEAILSYYGKFINSLTVVFSAGEQRSKTKLTLSYVWPRFEDVLKACDSIGWMNFRRRQLASPKSAVIMDRQAISLFS